MANFQAPSASMVCEIKDVSWSLQHNFCWITTERIKLKRCFLSDRVLAPKLVYRSPSLYRPECMTVNAVSAELQIETILYVDCLMVRFCAFVNEETFLSSQMFYPGNWKKKIYSKNMNIFEFFSESLHKNKW